MGTYKVWCKSCDGKGGFECPNCDEGRAPHVRDGKEFWRKCGQCHGTGKYDCEPCSGRGFFEEEQGEDWLYDKKEPADTDSGWPDPSDEDWGDETPFGTGD